MDQSYSDNDISLSPSRILERLQVLRQMQLLQRGILQKQRSNYQDSVETSSNITELVSHFSNSTSYNTFQSLLQSSYDNTAETTHQKTNVAPKQLCEKDLVEGVSVLNISQESEFIINSPISTRSRASASAKLDSSKPEFPQPESNSSSSESKKQISLDEMPILSPRKDFEDLIIEKLQSERNNNNNENKNNNTKEPRAKRQFLKKGEGMTRFGLRKEALVIQNTKSLPWKQRPSKAKHSESKNTDKSPVVKKKLAKVAVEIKLPSELPVVNPSLLSKSNLQLKINKNDCTVNSKQVEQNAEKDEIKLNVEKNENEILHCNPQPVILTNKKPAQSKHPLIANKGKTWANVLTKEQDDFLRQLKQSDYYKNYNSPAKSVVSEVSCDEILHKLGQEREKAEQNMFEFLESKVSNDSFHLENSFFNKFLKKSQFECSGESTPVVLQRCLQRNPDLLHIMSDLSAKNRTESICDGETCCSDYTECSSTNCSSPSTCCSCKDDETLDQTLNQVPIKKKVINKKVQIKNDTTKKNNCPQDLNQSHEDSVTTKEMKANMEEMNAKLVATSDLLKERLRELEDEIETFRKENSNLVKMREEFDLEKQKFYDDKTNTEQKFNEEKILSEYYIAEEKEKLTKQKQMYERYVREMRGRLNKKEKDEVIGLKKEISDLKEEIRSKDAKSTATIARLRNQLKITDKEKKQLLEEVEKLKKVNKRIQHSNDVTRRLTNMKYLAEINKKLSQMSSKDNLAEVILDRDVKYKAFEIERQSRKRNIQHGEKKITRPRAKSVPNLNVTSRYAKYFSQRDVISHMEPNDTLKSDMGTYTCPSDNEASDNDNRDHNASLDDAESIHGSDNQEESNELEKLYLERFQANSPSSNMSSFTNNNNTDRQSASGDGFYLSKSNSGSLSNPIRISKSPPLLKSARTSVTSNPRTSVEKNDLKLGTTCTSKSVASIPSYPSHTFKSSQMVAAMHNRISVSPEPASETTSLTKTSLNPTEIKKPDGSRELRFPNGNVKFISADNKYCKFLYYNGDIKENFYSDGRIKYFYSETKTVHTTHPDGLEVLEFADGQVEKRYKDGSSEIRLPNGSIRYFDPKNEHIREEWRFPDGTSLTVDSNGEQRIVFPNGQVEVHAKDHKRREFPDGTVKLVYTDGTAETRYATGRIRIKDKHGNLLMDSASR